MNSRLLTTLTVFFGFLSIFAAIILGKTLGITSSDLHDGEKLFQWPVIFTTLLILLLPCLLVSLIALNAQKLSLADLGFQSFSFKTVLIQFGFGFFIELIARILAMQCSTGSTMRLALPAYLDASWVGFYFWFLFLMFLNSLSEELVYRSYPIEAFNRSKLSFPVILLFTSILFSLVHFLAETPSLSSFCYRFAFGILAGVVYWQHRSIWPIIGLHTGLNVVANGFSDSDWKTGGIVLLQNVSGDMKSWSSFLVLSLAALGYYIYLKRKKVTP